MNIEKQVRTFLSIAAAATPAFHPTNVQSLLPHNYDVPYANP